MSSSLLHGKIEIKRDEEKIRELHIKRVCTCSQNIASSIVFFIVTSLNK
jgi:hypothetical protein